MCRVDNQNALYFESKTQSVSSSGICKMGLNAAVKWGPIRGLNLNDELWVSVGEALELILIQVHNEEFVCWSQLDRHLGKLLIEVCCVAPIFLQNRS